MPPAVTATTSAAVITSNASLVAVSGKFGRTPEDAR
jgi:hypothetical protein